MNENLENLKQKAVQFFRDKHWDELISVCTQIIDLEEETSKKARAYIQRGIANRLKGDLDRAIADLTRALKHKIDYAEAHYERGVTYSYKGENDLAIAEFDAALGLQLPDTVRARVHFDRGMAYNYTGGFDQAIEDFSRALELFLQLDDNQVTGLAYWGRAIAYIGKNSHLNAFKNFKEAGKCYGDLKSSSPKIYIAAKVADIHECSDEEEGSRIFELYIRLLVAISNIQEKQFYAPRENTEVAHYTCLHTLKSLAADGRFRLYNADYMNDPEEGRVFFEIMKKSGIDVQQVFYGDEDAPYPSPAYIGSFVRVDAKEPEQKDKLFLWRTYGKHDGQEAAGACLIFKHEGTVFAKSPSAQTGAMQQLQSNLLMPTGDRKNPEERQPLKPELYKIVYSDEEIPQEFPLSPPMQLAGIPSSDKWNKQERCEKLVESLKRIKEHIENEKDNENKRELRKLACDLLDTIRFLFKARHYQEEDEVRVVQVRYYDETKTTQKEEGIHVDAEQIPLRFYLETHDDFRFSEVILGPQARGEAEWKRWLKEQDKTLNVKRSGIKYGKPYL